MSDVNHNDLKPGVMVRVTQQIAARDHSWTTQLTGTVIDFSQRQTGSWFAHSKNDKLWLDRLTLKKADGEITTLILDDYSAVEVIGGAPDDAIAKKNETDLPA